MNHVFEREIELYTVRTLKAECQQGQAVFAESSSLAVHCEAFSHPKLL